ncbi:hypothetical protein FO519_007444 [Halicephalobus sp. NKZ332]|nr:hypothetical protein FO519_007444 [Halicephalobus sp. NKZ332]
MALSLPRLALRFPARYAVQSQRNSSGGFYGSNNFDDFRKGLHEGVKSAEGTKETWKKIFFIASIPCLAMTIWAAFKDHEHHHAHDRPEYVEYPYLTVRTKPFPWGDGNHSLFHNQREQWVPGVGYEKDRHH